MPTVTFVESSGGYWESEVYTVATDSTEIVTRLRYQSCSRESDSEDAEYACVHLVGVGESTSTLSHTGTARNIVITNVGGVNSNSGTVNAGKIGFQLMFVLCSAILGGIVVAL